MAVRDDIKAQREKLKGAPLKKKLSYFFYYYKIHLLVIAAVIVAVICIISRQLGTKPQALTGIFINAENTDINTDSLEKKTAKEAGIDLSKKSIFLDMSNTLTPGGPTDQYDYSTIEKIQTRAFNSKLDVIGADASNFRFFAKQSYFCDLRDVFSDAWFEKHKDDIYYIDKKVLDEESEKMNDPDYEVETEDKEKARSEELATSFKRPDPDEMDDPVPVGVIITDSSFIKQNNVYSKYAGVIGIIDNAPHKKAAAALVKTLVD
ncbi:MAG: hypothetical protein ACI4CS_10080 [Candidatus Weimeria sp.]